MSCFPSSQSPIAIAFDCHLNLSSKTCRLAMPDRSLLEADNVLHPLYPASEPSPVGSFVQLLLQSSVVVRLARWVHERLGERVALVESIVQ